MKIIIQPCTGYDAVCNYNKSIKNTINIKNYKDKLPEETFTKLLKKYPGGFVNFWGIKKGNTDYTQTVYNSIEEGDMVLFQRIDNKVSYIDSCCIVTMKTINYSLAKEVWRTNSDDNYCYLYFVNNFYNLSYKKIKTDEIYKLIGENKKRVYKITRFDKRDSDIIIKKFNLNDYKK